MARSGSTSGETARSGSRGLVILGVIVALALIAALILGVQRTGSSSANSNAGDGGASPSATSQSGDNNSSHHNDDSDGSDDNADSGSGDSEETEELARRIKGDPTALGERDAPVVIVEYADYRCPFCGVFSRDTMPKIKKKYIDTGKVRFEWRDMTIYGDQSEQAAVAARAAGQQGKYWEFHDAVYDAAPKRGHPDLPRKKLIGFAKKAHVPDLDQFKHDMTSKKLKKKVKTDTEEGRSLGATATPSFMINEEPVIGAQPEDVFEQTIDKALKKAGKK